VTERFVSIEAHAYVDDCLGREERIAFEARLRDDAELRRRVELWRQQNDAIRAAFRAPPRARGPLSVGRPSNENASATSPAIDSRRVRAAEAPSDPPGRSPQPSGAGRTAPRPARAGRRSQSTLRAAFVFSLATFMLAVSSAGGPNDERGPLAEAGLAAFRAFGANSSVALDIPQGDARALARQLSPRFVVDPAATNFDVAGWRLVGARFVPGTASAGAFVIWENHDRARIGLLIEALDAPANSAPRMRDFGGVAISTWTEGGKGFAAVGPDLGAVGALIRVGRADLAFSN